MGTMSLKEVTILLISVALFGCTQAPPPPVQKQAQEKKQQQQKKDYSQPHTAWAPSVAHEFGWY
jgi:predicted small lipoprotein YifL